MLPYKCQSGSDTARSCLGEKRKPLVQERAAELDDIVQRYVEISSFMPESPSSLIVGILPPTMKIENEDVTPTRPAPAPAPRAQRYCQMCLKLVLWFRAGLVLSPPVTGREHPFVQQRPSLPTLCFRPPRVASICIPTPAFTHHGCVSLDFTTS